MITLSDIKICVVGFGYVGLPLARLFSTRFPTILPCEIIDARL